jgi:hypothetical protein
MEEKMLEIAGKAYELTYSLKRIEMIEAATGKPLMAELKGNGGFLSISTLKMYFAYALKCQDDNNYVKIKEGIELAEKLIEDETAGYVSLNVMVLEALQRDCPFFFQAD